MLTQARVRELFDYDDGKLYWRIATSNRVHVGKEAGAADDAGYVHIGIDKKDYLLHRVIFLWHHGWLPKFVDHKDTDPANSRIDNLRPLTHSENIANGKTTTSKTGFRGVSFDKNMKRYFAQCMKNYKNHRIGYFSTPEKAHQAYLDLRQKLFPDVNQQ